jgi:sialic acid synthase SpsE
MTLKNFLGKKTFIIAEIGSNFDQSLEKAKKLIDVAKSSGADAVKFQLFKAEELYQKNSKEYKIFKSIELKSSWVKKLKRYSDQKKIIFFASSFDKISTKNLIKSKIKLIKIASSEITKIHELCYAASFNLPLIISTGMADLTDITEAVNSCRKIGNNQICLLHTCSLYPTRPKDMNILNMKKLSEIFDLPVGLSDHTLGNTAAIAAVALGAKVIEKHITLDKKSNGPDHFYAAEPKEFSDYVRKIRETEKMIVKPNFSINSEVRKTARRKSIFIRKDSKKNSLIKFSNIQILNNDARGIDIRYFNHLIGFRFKKNLKKKNPLRWKDIEFKK